MFSILGDYTLPTSDSSYFIILTAKSFILLQPYSSALFKSYIVIQIVHLRQSMQLYSKFLRYLVQSLSTSCPIDILCTVVFFLLFIQEYNITSLHLIFRLQLIILQQIYGRYIVFARDRSQRFPRLDYGTMNVVDFNRISLHGLNNDTLLVGLLIFGNHTSFIKYGFFLFDIFCNNNRLPGPKLYTSIDCIQFVLINYSYQGLSIIRSSRISSLFQTICPASIIINAKTE